LSTCITQGLSGVAASQETIRSQVEDIKRVAETLDPATGTVKKRQAAFADLQQQFADDSQDEHHQHLGKVMASFEPGLFVGGNAADFPQDNLELERWFRLPKGHARRIHGHRHAGVRIVHEGSTLLPTLNAHELHDKPFSAEELHHYRHSSPPAGQRAAIERRKIMRRARSKIKRRALLAELETRYLDGS
jgi:hypothetical protein